MGKRVSGACFGQIFTETYDVSDAYDGALEQPQT